MKCELCGREYIALGVHLRHKHQVDPDDYREAYGILRTTALVDGELSEQLRASQKKAMQDADYRAAAIQRCKENSEAKKGKPGPGMTRAGKAALTQRNINANDRYLRQQAPKVAAVLREKKTMLDVRKALGTGPKAAKKMAALMGVEYTRQTAKTERDKRAAATIRANALTRVAAVMIHFSTTKSAAEMCRRGGISIQTYKNWLSAGLIPRHPNGKGPRAT